MNSTARALYQLDDLGSGEVSFTIKGHIMYITVEGVTYNGAAYSLSEALENCVPFIAKELGKREAQAAISNILYGDTK